MSDASEANEANENEAPQGLRCDFCGKEVPQVRRIALDEGYERLQTRHNVQYACPECSRAKEEQRRSAGRG
ncbi:MAG: hypothetical protein ACQGVC_20085 [Myxococcota bacterium]